MSNMSYCRFENTAKDLADCRDALDNFLNGQPEERGEEVALSESELEWAKELVRNAMGILDLVANQKNCDRDELDENDADAVLDEAQTEALAKDKKAKEEDSL